MTRYLSFIIIYIECFYFSYWMVLYASADVEYGPISLRPSCHILLRQRSNSKHFILTVIDFKRLGGKHILCEQ